MEGNERRRARKRRIKKEIEMKQKEAQKVNKQSK